MIIFVNAVNIKSGGGVKMLNSFLVEFSKKHSIHLFVNKEVLQFVYQNDQVTIIEKEVAGFVSKFKWYIKGLKDYTRRTNIRADVVVSLQNLKTLYYRNVLNYTYIQNAIPFFKLKGVGVDKSTKFYKLYFHLHAALFSRKSDILVVQTVALEKLIKNHRFVRYMKIIIEPPYVINLNSNNSYLEKEKIVFYPAAEQKFKNHGFLIDVAEKLLGLSKHNVRLVLTVSMDYLRKNCNNDLLKKLVEEDLLVCLGKVSYKEVCEIYARAKIVVMPSSIESYGLPIIEGLSFGSIVIANNIDLFREVGSNQENIHFLDLVEDMWVQKINNCLIEKTPAFVPIYSKSWKWFLQDIDMKG